jgi:hypothetical protein
MYINICNLGLDERTPVLVGIDNLIEAAENMRTSVSPQELAQYEQEARKQNIK